MPISKNLPRLVKLLSVMALTANSISANVTLATPFASHMVLQRSVTVPVWGTAAAAEKVTVTFQGQTITTEAAANGKWMLNLDSTGAGGPFELIVAGANTVTLTDVMVGEVWIASGQSNMSVTMSSFGGANLDSAKLADYPNIRLMGMYPSLSKWHACTPSAALNFSATAYYFALNLHRTLKVPVGIITAAVGGTPVERWMDDASYKADAILSQGTGSNDLYKTYVAPLAPFATRGFIWYQGESNTFPALYPHYRDRFSALIKGWRKVWGAGDLYFFFVQLANCIDVNPGSWPPVREGQRLSLSVPNTAMAVAIDIGDPNDIHPKNKWELGRRLALPARALIYGETDLVYSGPMYESNIVRGKTMRLRFRFAETGLVTKNNAKPVGFEIAGANNTWYAADGTIDKDTLILSSTSVTTPTKVRYAWMNSPPTNLYNGAGLPASPFTTEGAQLPVVSIAPGEGLWVDKLRMTPVEKFQIDALGRALEIGKPDSHKPAFNGYGIRPN